MIGETQIPTTGFFVRRWARIDPGHGPLGKQRQVFELHLRKLESKHRQLRKLQRND